MARRPAWQIVDLALGGTLEDDFGRMRAEGQSFDDIARWLDTRGVDVTGETVRSWCIGMGIHQPETAA